MESEPSKEIVPIMELPTEEIQNHSGNTDTGPDLEKEIKDLRQSLKDVKNIGAKGVDFQNIISLLEDHKKLSPLIGKYYEDDKKISDKTWEHEALDQTALAMISFVGIRKVLQGIILLSAQQEQLRTVMIELIKENARIQLQQTEDLDDMQEETKETIDKLYEAMEVINKVKNYLEKLYNDNIGKVLEYKDWALKKAKLYKERLIKFIQINIVVIIIALIAFFLGKVYGRQ